MITTPPQAAPSEADDLPPLPKPCRAQGRQMSYDGDDKAFFDCYDNVQMREYVLADRQARAQAPDKPQQAAPESAQDERAAYEGWRYKARYNRPPEHNNTFKAFVAGAAWQARAAASPTPAPPQMECGYPYCGGNAPECKTCHLPKTQKESLCK